MNRAACAMALVLVASCRGESTKARETAFAGSGACVQCHRTEYKAWRGSQHAAAMQVATPRTVLGNFANARFTNGGVTYTFARRGDTSVVNTIGPTGAPADYAIRYTFGVWPLQQYLVELTGGKMQALLTAWDARPAAAGGQRWFSLSPGTEAAHTDRFHWTGRQYNWNYMCADCHSTAVRKEYLPAADSFHTTFSEINVACEACHGPASEHVAWGRHSRLLRALIWRDDRLPAQLTERRGAQWIRDSSAAIAHRSTPRTTDREIETCAQCHARRNHIADGYTAGKPFLDYYVPLPLLPGMYYPDGQQREEVYTVASFEQSRMYAAGVTCSDCHNPHTGKPRLPGNQVCAQCHNPAKYDTSAHHFHSAASGAQCISCHMPDSAYMQIDRRHDHSLRIPRPDLSVAIGLPNACSRCHSDRGAQWAADAVRNWYPKQNPGFQTFTPAFVADERDDPGAADSLARVANDSRESWIARASALARLGSRASPVALELARRYSRDSNAVIRLYALELAGNLAERDRLAIALPLLTDARRAIRQEAAWLLAPLSRELDVEPTRGSFRRAAAEFVASQRYNADRAPSRLRLASFYVQLGQIDSAAMEVRAAARLDSAAAGDFVRGVAGAAASDARAAALWRAIRR